MLVRSGERSSFRELRGFHRVKMIELLEVVLIILIIPRHRLTSGADFTSEHCSWETFNVQCALPDEVVLIKSALYGRMQAGRCITSKYAEAMGCRSDVTYYLDEHCSGRQNCSMLVATIDQLRQPCAKDFKLYLEINYECAKVSFWNECRAGNTTRLLDQSGYLALFPSSNNPHKLGSLQDRSRQRCSWTIAVEPGKRVNISWKVFGGQTLDVWSDACCIESERHLPTIFCPVFLLFRENGDDGKSSRQCGRTQLATGSIDSNSEVIYTSRGSTLEIQAIFPDSATSRGGGGADLVGTAKPANNWKPYIIQYKAFGCATMLPPEGATMTQTGDEAAIVCTESQETWYVRCQNGEWVGQFDNCTRKVAERSPKTSPATSQSYDELKQGIVLAVSIGIVLGVLVGAVMMCVIFVAKKSQQRHNESVERPLPNGLYEMRGSKMCRCPALYVQDPNDSSALYEYTYACRSSNTDGAITCGAPEKLQPLDAGSVFRNQRLTNHRTQAHDDVITSLNPNREEEAPRSGHETSLMFYDLDTTTTASGAGTGAGSWAGSGAGIAPAMKTLQTERPPTSLPSSSSCTIDRCACKSSNVVIHNRYGLDLLHTNPGIGMATSESVS